MSAAAPATTAARRRMPSWARRGTEVGGDVWRDFVRGDLEGGVIRLRGLGAPMQALVVLASLVFFALAGVFLTNQWWRDRFELVAVGRDLPGRGAFVPTPLVAVTYFLMAFSLALILTGALHVARWVRLLVLVVWLAVASTALAATVGGAASGTVRWGGVAATLAVPVVFAIRWRAPRRPAGEFVPMFVLVSTVFALGQHQLRLLDSAGGTGLGPQVASVFIIGLAALLGPRLVVAGLDTAAFGATTATWVLSTLERRVHAAATTVVLVGFGAWRLRDVVREVGAHLRADRAGALASLAGGLVLLLVVAGTWWVFDALADRAEGEEDADPDVIGETKRLVLRLGALYLAVPTVLGFLTLVAAGIDAQGRTTALAGRIGSWNRWYEGSWLVDATPIAYAVAALAAALWLVRRPGRRATALVLAEIGAVAGLVQLTLRGRPLHVLATDGPSSTDPWIVLAVALLASAWAVGRRLDRHRVARLVFVLLLSGLVKQADFLGNPFALVLGFAGVGFIAFGLVWGFLTAGGWTNAESPSFPRTSRILLFLGYTLFTLTVSTWFVMSHDLANKSLLSDTWGGLGQTLFGDPMLYALLVVTLVGSVTSRHFGAGPVPAEAAAGPEPAESGR